MNLQSILLTAIAITATTLIIYNSNAPSKIQTEQPFLEEFKDHMRRNNLSISSTEDFDYRYNVYV